MKRIGNISLLAIAALAIAASMSVASASASRFVAEQYPATLSSNAPLNNFTLTAGGGTFVCDGGAFSQNISTPEESLKPALVAPSCYEWGSKKTALKMNGCDFTFHPGAETSPGIFNGTFDIGPTGCGPIVFSYNGETKCTLSIAPKSGLAATYENKGTGKTAYVTITANAKGLEGTFGPSGCPVVGADNNVQFTGSWEVKSKNGAGAQIGLRVSKTAGIFLAGAKSEEKAKQPRLEAEKYPMAISGSNQGGKGEGPRFKVGESNSVCEEAQFSTEASAATTELSVGATFGKCKVGVMLAKVKMGGCHFVYDILNAGPPYTGTADIVCAKESEAIEIRMYQNAAGEAEDKAVCIATYGPQTGFAGVGFANIGAGLERAVSVSTNLSGLKYSYTRLAGYCPYPLGNATYTDGTFSAKTTLGGVL